ncbi:hypothetical protein RvVAR0630_pl04250 (plasmid) [Agrobacterium vitis]|nr:hypothetical protein RvVAR0630_pl04250 [Agrobacterium vitis]
MPIETSAILMAVAMKVGCPVAAKKKMNAPLTMIVTVIAAERRCIRQKMQEITVIAI